MSSQSLSAQENYEEAILGAGCFWCTEAQFQQLKGVISVISGYTGGEVNNPTYKEICSGTTGHAEVTKVLFDPSIISYDVLIEVFWTTHDPTTLNRQGADIGTQYRSAIFYTTPEQKTIAEKSKTEVAPLVWDNPIVTEITAASEFYPAEAYHQDYYSSNPSQGYCRAVISPKVSKFRKRFKKLLKD